MAKVSFQGAVSVKMENLETLIVALNKRIEKSQKDTGSSYVVGYTAPYAVFVHENLVVKHKSPTQAKYLEQPAREKQGELAESIKNSMQKGQSLLQALSLAGIRLLQFSQALVPVGTGLLKRSGYSTLVKGKE